MKWIAMLLQKYPDAVEARRYHSTRRGVRILHATGGISHWDDCPFADEVPERWTKL